MSFAARIVFVRHLSAEYLGLNGLFANILTMLSFAEMGIGSAITYSIYHPLAVRDWGQIGAHVRMFRKAYWVIAAVISVTGLAIAPFIPLIVGDVKGVPNVTLIFLLFVANSAAAYAGTSRRALLIADQKRFIATLYRYGFFLVLNLVQIVVLVLTANYLLFLVAQLIFTLLENLAVFRHAGRLYPKLAVTPVVPMASDRRKEIFRNVRALVLHKFGSAVVAGTDSIMISLFVGVVSVGLYSNYLLITSAIGMILAMAFSSITASVGNLGVSASRLKELDTFRALDLAVSWVYSFAAISLLVLMDPFVELWLGPDFVLEPAVSLAVVVNFYVSGVRYSLFVFKEAKGIFWPDRFRPAVEASVNLVASLFLGQLFGIVGVLAGTVLSMLLVCLPWEPIVIFRHGVNERPRVYYQRYFFRVILAVVGGIATWKAASLIPFQGIAGLVIRGALCLAMPNLIYFLVYFRSPEFDRLRRLVGHKK